MDRWLVVSVRNPNPYSKFSLEDFGAKPINDEIKKYLLQLLGHARFNPDFLAFAKARLPWDKLKQVQDSRVPRHTTIKRGDFGEVVSAALLEKFYGYVVPVAKLRSTVIGNQTMPSTDVLALRLDVSGEITEVCFVESKLRTTMSKQVAVQGYQQLERDQAYAIPGMLVFTAERLFERGDHVMSEKCLAYLRSRSETTLDSSSLHLFFDKSVWSEDVLENLEEANPTLSPLTVRLVQIENLASLTDELYASMGILDITDEDDE